MPARASAHGDDAAGPQISAGQVLKPPIPRRARATRRDDGLLPKKKGARAESREGSNTTRHPRQGSDGLTMEEVKNYQEPG